MNYFLLKLATVDGIVTKPLSYHHILRNETVIKELLVFIYHLKWAFSDKTFKKWFQVNSFNSKTSFGR